MTDTFADLAEKQWEMACDAAVLAGDEAMTIVFGSLRMIQRITLGWNQPADVEPWIDRAKAELEQHPSHTQQARALWAVIYAMHHVEPDN